MIRSRFTDARPVWVIFDRACGLCEPLDVRFASNATGAGPPHPSLSGESRGQCLKCYHPIWAVDRSVRWLSAGWLVGDRGAPVLFQDLAVLHLNLELGPQHNKLILECSDTTRLR